MLVLVLVMRWYRSATMDIFYADLFFFAKLGILVLLYMIQNYSYLAIYVPLILVVSFMYDQPIYSGKGAGLIKWVTPALFDKLVLNSENNAASAKSKSVTIMTASWNPLGNQLTPLFAQLALKHPSVPFYRLDIGKAPAVAEQLRISLDGSSKQLPTLIMFESGKEKARIPQILRDSFLSTPTWSVEALEVGLGLRGQ